MIERENIITGSIYFEFINEIKDLPWYHEAIKTTGKYAYISEIAIDFPEDISLLFKNVLRIAKNKNCKAIIWLTGESAKHDKIEKKFLTANGFNKFKHVESWECEPNYFIYDHYLWKRDLI